MPRREFDRCGLNDTPIAASDESLYDQAVATWEKCDEPARVLVNQVNVHSYQKDGRHRDVCNQISRGKRLRDAMLDPGAAGRTHP